MYAVLLLFSAIGVEVAATLSLPRARGFHDPGWTVIVLAGYILSIWLLTLVVKEMPVSIAYAIWAGVGTAATAVLAAIFMDERLDWVKAICLGLIIVGVVGLNMTGGAHA